LPDWKRGHRQERILSLTFRRRRKEQLIASRIPQWETVSHKAFLNETVELDGKRFYRCTFTNARLSFRGNAPCELLECELATSVVLETDNDAIRCYLMPARTLEAMAKPEHVSVDKHGHARLIQPSLKEISAKQEALGISESDPRIYVDVFDERQVDQITRLKLTNRGSGDAHRVQVCAVGLRTATVRFDSVDVIPSGSPALIEPSIDSYEVIQRRNLIFAMMKEWETFNDPNMAIYRLLPTGQKSIELDTVEVWGSSPHVPTISLNHLPTQPATAWEQKGTISPFMLPPQSLQSGQVAESSSRPWFVLPVLLL
jgi:hypothetical protein